MNLNNLATLTGFLLPSCRCRHDNHCDLFTLVALYFLLRVTRADLLCTTAAAALRPSVTVNVRVGRRPQHSNGNTSSQRTSLMQLLCVSADSLASISVILNTVFACSVVPNLLKQRLSLSVRVLLSSHFGFSTV